LPGITVDESFSIPAKEIEQKVTLEINGQPTEVAWARIRPKTLQLGPPERELHVISLQLRVGKF
jgi:hypothetical protein